MPYEHEKANPYGYSSILQNPLIKTRLGTFIPQPPEEIEFDEEVEATRQITEDENIKYLIAVDGSVKGVSLTNSDVGFFKVSVVVEDLHKLRLIDTRAAIDPNAVAKCYRSYSIESVLPGQGIAGAVDKFREEVYETFRNIRIDPEGIFDPKGQELTLGFDTLLQVLDHILMNKRTVICNACATIQECPTDTITCSGCGLKLYITDVLDLHVGFHTYSSNENVYSQVMSTVERILMLGLLLKVQNRKFKAIFITDGQLALFNAKKIVTPMLKSIQKIHDKVILCGIEKTGVFQEYGDTDNIQKVIRPGEVMAVTNKILFDIVGEKKYDKLFHLYGRHFYYKTRDGLKIFVFTVPPINGRPYDVKREFNWSDYPTVNTICNSFEGDKTNRYGVKTSALSVIAQANNTASIPKNLGEIMLKNFALNSGL